MNFVSREGASIRTLDKVGVCSLKLFENRAIELQFLHRAISSNLFIFVEGFMEILINSQTINDLKSVVEKWYNLHDNHSL